MCSLQLDRLTMNVCDTIELQKWLFDDLNKHTGFVRLAARSGLDAAYLAFQTK